MRHLQKKTNPFALSQNYEKHSVFAFCKRSCRWGAAWQSLRELAGISPVFHLYFTCISSLFKKKIPFLNYPENPLELKNFGIWGNPSYVVAFFLGNLCRCRCCCGSHRSLSLPLRWNTVSPCGCRRKDVKNASLPFHLSGGFAGCLTACGISAGFQDLAFNVLILVIFVLHDLLGGFIFHLFGL